MKLFDAIKASPVSTATRQTGDGHRREGKEPNIVIMDERHTPPLPKVFRAVENFAWERRSLKEAKTLLDWAPASNRGCPEIAEDCGQ